MDNDSNFKNWFDAIWLGDEEHGQFIPNKNDEDYAEYLEQYTLAHGAYKYALSHSKERIAELGKDAERYRWLRHGTTQEARVVFGRYPNNIDIHHEKNHLINSALDAAIDVAMKGSNDDK
jgi:hypothetical protein